MASDAAAVMSSSASPITPINVPDFDRFPFTRHDLSQDPGSKGFEVHDGLVGFNLGDDFACLHRVALMLLPSDDDAFFHRIRQFGHDDSLAMCPHRMLNRSESSRVAGMTNDDPPGDRRNGTRRLGVCPSNAILPAANDLQASASFSARKSPGRLTISAARTTWCDLLMTVRPHRIPAGGSAPRRTWGWAGEKVTPPVSFGNLPAHSLAGVRKHDAPYSSRRAPCGLASTSSSFASQRRITRTLSGW